MKTNDNILIYMIEHDLKQKGCEAKQLVDVVVDSPKLIKVGANEIVYIHFVQASSEQPFELEISSANAVHKYTDKNTINGVSNLITRHWGSVKVKPSEKLSYFIHYVKVKL